MERVQYEKPIGDPPSDVFGEPIDDDDDDDFDDDDDEEW
jgi:hypothetical protein